MRGVKVITDEKELNSINISLMGELIGEITHDFNNSLTTILGFVQLVRKSDKLDTSLKEHIDIIYEAALDGKSIVDKVQYFDRREHDTNNTNIYINSVIKTALKMASIKWKSLEKNNDLKFNIIETYNSNEYIFCNARQLREVILNLILNSIDAMDNGGDLFIETYDKDEKVIIEIRDTGIGMDKETIDNIFKPHFSTKGNSGNGIGLSVSKKIVEKYGGTIEVESELGKGSLFRIILNKSDNLN